MRVILLSDVLGGIDRRTTYGGASPTSLYDLVNGYVDGEGNAVSRPCAAVEILYPAGSTKGIMVWEGRIWTFSAQSITLGDDKYDVLRVNDPENPDADLVEIHFAAPYLGYPYVVAEFDSGRVWHFWIIAPSAWTADTTVAVGTIVAPTVPNGFYYRASMPGNAVTKWAPDIPRSLDDVVVPTESNGFKYRVVNVEGDNPRSGSTEPDWPEEDGAQVVEDADAGAPAGTPGTGDTDPTPGGPGTVPPDIGDRYGNGGGRNSPGSEAEQ